MKKPEWIESFDKTFSPRRDCSNAQKHIDSCQGCITIIVEESIKVEQYISTLIEEIFGEVEATVDLSHDDIDFKENLIELKEKYL